MKNKTLTLLIGLASILYLVASSPLRAQSPTYTFPQSETEVLASALNCTGAPQTFPILHNLGQTQHYVYVTSTAATMRIELDGIDAGGNTYRLSNIAMIGNGLAGSSPVLAATGYFPKLQVLLTCAVGSSFTLNYTGTSATSNINAGAYQIAQVDRVISGGIFGSSAGSSLSAQFDTPFGSAFGTLSFIYGGTGPAGSTISVLCLGEMIAGSISTYVFTPATTTAIVQQFIVPDASCPNVQVIYTPGGASASSFDLEYIFPQPGFKLVQSDAHITATTATVVKPGPGTVQTVVVGTPVTGTFSLFDLAPAACTATPVTNVKSVINETAANPPASIPFNGDLFVNGICAKASVAGDYTVVYQ
jgi:hypothetical protein